MQCGMETATVTNTQSTQGTRGLPEDAEIVGYDGGVTFFRSPSRGLVYVAQGTSVWALQMTDAGDQRQETTAR
jgi:hypothetical protein